MYEFAGSKSAKLVVQRIREISSPDSSVYCLACLCGYPNKSSHIFCWFCCLLHYIIYYIILSLYYPCVLYSNTKRQIHIGYSWTWSYLFLRNNLIIDVDFSFRNGGDKLPLRSQGRHLHFASVLRIHAILVWIRIRIRGSMPLTNGSGSRRPKNMWIRWIRIRIRFASYKR